MVTVKCSAAKGHDALVRNVVLGEQGVQDPVFEKPPEAKQKQEAPPQRPWLPQSPCYPQHSPDCLCFIES